MIAALENPPQWQTLEVAAVETTGGEDHSVLDDQSLLFGGAVPGTTLSRRAEQLPQAPSSPPPQRAAHSPRRREPLISG